MAAISTVSGGQWRVVILWCVMVWCGVVWCGVVWCGVYSRVSGPATTRAPVIGTAAVVACKPPPPELRGEK